APPGGNVDYTVVTAVPKKSDRLTVNASAGDDVVNILATQPDGPTTDPGGQVFVNTLGGDDQITVGNPAVTFEHAGLDDFFGPLNIDAGADHNQLTFTEGYSYVADRVRMSTGQVVRYTKPAVVPANAGRPSETAYPFIFNYTATGGDFAVDPPNRLGGAFFDTSLGGTKLYIPQTGVNAPVTVNASGQNDVDHIYVGFDGANDPVATVEGVPVVSSFPSTAATATLDDLPPLLPVNQASLNHPILEVDDEGVAVSESYTLRMLFPPATPTGLLLRTGAADILYSPGGSNPGVDLTLNAGNRGNSIDVQEVESNTTATINTGRGNDKITVGHIPVGNNFFDSLDHIGGAHTHTRHRGGNKPPPTEEENTTTPRDQLP